MSKPPGWVCWELVLHEKMFSRRAIRSTSNLDPGLDKSPLESLAALLEYSALSFLLTLNST
jgi:hypothetical protein